MSITEHCDHCGAPVHGVAAPCPHCGARLALAAPAAADGADTVPPGGLWRRAAAGVIDLVVVVRIATGFLPTEAAAWRPLVVTVLFCAYWVALEASPWGATLGKRALSLRVTRADGARLGVARSLGRTLAKALTWFTCGLGFAAAAFSPRRRTLHDVVAGTLVVRPAAVPAPARPTVAEEARHA